MYLLPSICEFTFKMGYQAPIEKISEFVLNSELFFNESFDQLKKINIKDIKILKK